MWSTQHLKDRVELQLEWITVHSKWWRWGGEAIVLVFGFWFLVFALSTRLHFQPFQGTAAALLQHLVSTCSLGAESYFFSMRVLPLFDEAGAPRHYKEQNGHIHLS